jgi:hypothetical protein
VKCSPHLCCTSVYSSLKWGWKQPLFFRVVVRVKVNAKCCVLAILGGLHRHHTHLYFHFCSCHSDCISSTLILPATVLCIFLFFRNLTSGLTRVGQKTALWLGVCGGDKHKVLACKVSCLQFLLAIGYSRSLLILCFSFLPHASPSAVAVPLDCQWGYEPW